MDFKEGELWLCGPDLPGSGRGPASGSYEHVVELSGSQKERNFLTSWQTIDFCSVELITICGQMGSFKWKQVSIVIACGPAVG